jgi:hypothetical protein
VGHSFIIKEFVRVSLEIALLPGDSQNACSGISRAALSALFIT